MPWEVDPSEPIISPARTLAYYRELQIGDESSLTLPGVMVATFQKMVVERLADRIGHAQLVRWPTPLFWPLARGEFGGRSIAVSRLPMGAPAAAAALELMISAGVRTILLVGSAGSLQPSLPVGSLVIATGALRHEGTSHHYLPESDPAAPDAHLVQALAAAADRKGVPAPTLGPVWTTDAIYRECMDTVTRLAAQGYLAVEMEAAALFAVAKRHGVRAAALLAMSDEIHDGWHPGFHTLAYRRAILSAADLALEAASSL
jgi:uridine phosphorylase